MKPRLVLVGAGHAHLETIARLDELIALGARVVLVAPEAFHYTGTATGELSGRYPPGFGRIDVAAIARARGAAVMQERATAIDVGGRRVQLESGGELEFDFLSLDLGSAPRAEALPGSQAPNVFRSKPASSWLALRERLSAAGGRDPRLVVLGGGASGCEIAANLKALSPRSALTLVHSAPKLLGGGRAGALVERALAERGIALIRGRRGVAVHGDELALDDSTALRFDALVVATGHAPHPLVARTGLAVDERGALLVDATLRAEDEPRVFAVGDSAARRGHRGPKNGVHAIREGRALLENLRRVLRGRAPRRAAWPVRTLQILDLADGTALALYGGLAHRSRAMQWWKGAIDRRWLARWRRAAAAVHR